MDKIKTETNKKTKNRNASQKKYLEAKKKGRKTFHQTNSEAESNKFEDVMPKDDQKTILWLRLKEDLPGEKSTILFKFVDKFIILYIAQSFERKFSVHLQTVH